MVGTTKPGGIVAFVRFWGAISASGDVRTRCRDVGVGGMLKKCLLIDSTDLEWRDSIYTWCCRMDFRDVPLPAKVSELERPLFHEGVVRSG